MGFFVVASMGSNRTFMELKSGFPHFLRRHEEF